ncbi:putative isomerase YbhE [Sistotremastrum niveocremeum HHB9708]|uniref:Putative isomerase YbhE n=1 Tax=Sistotremastrum niveocremeum HHB9708 TaxID=1314777 RepID=A0A164Y487_9AGAM|nr:putative isomerase YbhE [Sistotremastrum niveocremeum HHB9708]
MSSSYTILVGSGTREITTLKFTPPSSSSSASLIVSATLEVGHHPGWIEKHPSKPSFVFANIEEIVPDADPGEGELIVLKVDEEGQGAVIGRARTGGEIPAHFWVGESEVVVANYFGPSIIQIPFTPNEPYLFSSAAHTVKFEGKGPNPNRQTMSHPHQVYHHPSREELLVPDLGTDRVYRLLKDDTKDGYWTLRDQISVKPGSGPRHVVVHDEIIYIVAELTNEIIAYTLPPITTEESPKPVHIKTVSSLSTTPAPEALGAEILFSHPTNHIVASNRKSGHPLGDQISVFTPHPNFELVGEIRTGLDQIRAMQFSEDGKWLIAGGVKNGGVKVYEWNGSADGGWGKEVASVFVAVPTDFVWL